MQHMFLFDASCWQVILTKTNLLSQLSVMLFCFNFDFKYVTDFFDCLYLYLLAIWTISSRFANSYIIWYSDMFEPIEPRQWGIYL